VRQDLTIGQMLLRATGLTVLAMTALFCGLLTVTYLGGDQFGGWRQPAVVVSLACAAVATVTMTVDSFDLWMLGRHFGRSGVRRVHSLVFVLMLVAFALSIGSRTSGLLLVMSPALVIYLFTVLRPPAPPRPQPSRGQGSGSGRQRRGGRKRS
jgi:hypothetical protein